MGPKMGYPGVTPFGHFEHFDTLLDQIDPI